MSILNFRKSVFFLCFALLMVGALTDDAEAAPAKETGIFSSVKEQYYDNLSPPGKFVTGMGIGFVGSRLTVKTASNAVKVAGATFIVSEVANYAGVFDKVSEENNQKIQMARNSVVKAVNKFRLEVRRQLNPTKVKEIVDSALTKEKMATLGAATGAFVGFVL